ncbi:MAG: DNA-binding protein [Magnetococcales bacterium]|nr:DNA-binding protein [Magnetococcales bacterium]
MTPQQFKQSLKNQGKTLKKWAIEHGYDPIHASRVLNGNIKGHFGKGHDIAVAMGLKAQQRMAA